MTGWLVVKGWQCVLVCGLLTVQLLRQVEGGGNAPDLMVNVACRRGEGPSRQRHRHTVTV